MVNKYGTHAAHSGQTYMKQVDGYRIKLLTEPTHKAVKHGVRFEEVDERFTTQVCSHRGTIPDARPKGIADLGMRVWTGGDCEAVHGRDRNAAINILRRGRATLAVGISVV